MRSHRHRYHSRIVQGKVNKPSSAIQRQGTTPWWKLKFLILYREHGRGENNLIGANYIPEGFANVANMDDVRLERNALVFGVTNQEGDQSIGILKLLPVH